jgi:hypothetical protein
MTAIALDTHAAARRFKRAGFTEDQVATTQNQAITFILSGRTVIVTLVTVLVRPIH